jgi:flagellar protein FliO/FliZ
MTLMPARLMSLLFLLYPATARAAETAEVAGTGQLGSGLRLLAGLLLVVGLLLLFYALSRRGLSWLPKPRGGAIHIREMRPLGPKKSLCLVEVRGRELLLGLSADRIELLCQLGDAPREDFDTALQTSLKESQP